MDQNLCEIVGHVAVYLERHPDGGHGRIKAFLKEEPDLWGVADVTEYTGWTTFHISRLCAAGKLPYIPGRPARFVPNELRKAIEQMQVGGIYGRRKGKALKSKK